MLKTLLLGLLVLGLLLGGGFVANGLWPSWRTPRHGSTAAAPRALGAAPQRLRAMAFNIAKCFARDGITSFRPAREVRRCLDRIAALIVAQRADLVFLTEIDFDCAPCPGSLNQVRYLARAARMHQWAFGPNYDFGLPLYNISSGNALLSRFAIEPVAVRQLSHGAPFYNPVGNRRILWVKLPALRGPDGKALRVAVLRNHSFDIHKNREQVAEVVAEARRSGGALLGGDFNAWPGTDALALYSNSGLFNKACLRGAPSFPAKKPDSRIDFVLAPKSWRLVSQRVLQTDVSDHLPVLYELELPAR